MSAFFPVNNTLRSTVVAISCLCASLSQAQALKMSWQMASVPGDGEALGASSLQPMGLLQAFDLALAKDLTYASALAAFRAVQEQVPQARAGLRPQVSLVGSMGVSSSKPRSTSSGSDVVNNQLNSVTDTQSTTDTNTSSASQQTGFPDFDSSTVTSSSTSSSSRLSEQTSEQINSQSWQTSSQTDRSKVANAELNLRWPLYRPAADRQVEQSQINEAQARVRLQAARQDVAIRLCKAYFDVILVQENLHALASELTAIDSQRKVAEKSFEEGETTIADVKEAQAKWDIAQAQQLSQRNALQVKLAALQGLIGERAPAVQSLKVQELLAQPPSLGSLNDWLRRTAEQSFPVLIETLGLAAAEKEIAKQSAVSKPSLDFVASLGAGRTLQRSRSDSLTQTSSVTSLEEPSQSTVESQTTASSVRDGETAAGTSQTSTSTDLQSSSTETSASSSARPASTSRSARTQYDAYVGVRLNVPLYDGGFASSKVREAIARQEQKALDLQRARSEAALATETAFLEAQGYFAEAGALKAAELSGQVALKSNQMGYLAGVRINADILNAQQQLFAVRRDLIRAQVSALLASLQLKANAGVLLDEDVSRLAQWLR
jgi:outer membrane protein